MIAALAWMSAAAAVYFLLRAVALDNRLWGKRRGGASRWSIWIPPQRWRDFSHAEEGTRTRGGFRRAIALAVLFGLLALALSYL